MTSKTVTSLAFAAGFALALGAMPSAHAQYYPTPAPSQAERTSQYPGPGPALPQAPSNVVPAQPSYGAASGHIMASPSPPELAGTTMPRPYAAPPMQTHLATNGPQASRGDFGDWSARRNNIESARYDRLLQTNMGFRQARMRKECGPIGDPQLHSQCLASFNQYEPVMTGSSTAPRRMRHHRAAGY